MTEHMVCSMVPKLTFAKRQKRLRVIDPFAGDGRLIVQLVNGLVKSKKLPKEAISVTVMDVDCSALDDLQSRISAILRGTGVKCEVKVTCGDSFAEKTVADYDICITNPPWCVLKPVQKIGDHVLDPDQKREFNGAVRAYQKMLWTLYPTCDAGSGFGRNCVNLSRCGLEKALRLVRRGGFCAAVMPATLFSDQVSGEMRKILIEDWDLVRINYYPAECKLFGKVDQTSVTLVARNTRNGKRGFEVCCFDRQMNASVMKCDEGHVAFMRECDYVVPFGYEEKQWTVLAKLRKYPTLGSFSRLEFARELDETRVEERLAADGKVRFVKGYMVDRYSTEPPDVRFFSDPAYKLPLSVWRSKIVWRDVSRESQKRRMKATILPSGYIAGNSLGVLYSPENDMELLKYVLAILNSRVFEFQARLHLVSNHVPAGILRQIRIPQTCDNLLKGRICQEVDRALSGAHESEEIIESLVAKAYGLTDLEYGEIVKKFTAADADKVPPGSPKESKGGKSKKATRIKNAKRTVALTCPPNHYAAKLSDLDKLIISYVPQGGNWKDIPESVPSQRLAQIRESFKAGKGSRSTYYGRLREDAPAYTISTYFSRPGNGCNIHYGQPRTLSQREAARIQSFPDSFEFKGTKGSIDDQIGNAVPPLLAYQIAEAMPVRKGMFVDLFCGAGGLALGFIWAGWKPIVSNDIMPGAIETHSHNINDPAICGDITKEEVVSRIVAEVVKARKANPELPLYVLGGPPCQGFSTANCNRSTSDQRNWLFKAYLHILELLKPDGFVFENVTGVLNFQGGKFFEMIVKDLKTQVDDVTVMKLNAAEYAVPQRRERVIIFGSTKENVSAFKLDKKTYAPKVCRKASRQMTLLSIPEPDLPPAISVREAFSDLPPISESEDGSAKPYVTSPSCGYQRLMRGEITAAEFLNTLKG